MIITFIWLFILFACWGSFLNVVAYRITYDKPFFTRRSYCPACNATIAWYDNIPILSWIFLLGKCRTCRAQISILYPLTELISGILFSALFYTVSYNWGVFIFHFIFFTALVVATRTDLEDMVIPQLFSIWLMPVGFLGAYLGFLEVSLLGSLLGGFIGYGFLWIVNVIFRHIKKREGIGLGDLELLGMIGAFTGPFGVWFTVLIASISGLIIGGVYLLFVKKTRGEPIPFGPFLALGATIFFFFKPQIMMWVF